jgi:hypothetical protein
MVWGILDLVKKKQPTEPSTLDTIHAESRAGVLRDENVSTNAEMQAAGGIAFDFQVIDDEKVLGLFDPSNPLFNPLVLPLLPMFSRMMYLTNCTELEAATYKLKVDLQITLLKNRATSTEEYMLLDSLLGYAEMRINDSVGGFKLIKLTERTKNINLKEIPAEKKK